MIGKLLEMNRRWQMRGPRRRAGANPTHARRNPQRRRLVFEQRRFNHFGYEPQGDDDRYVRALIGSIRHKALGTERLDSHDPAIE